MQQINLKHQTHLETILKFIGLLLILLGYFTYLSLKFDFVTGGILTALTWSFFVLCTPVADAGFLLDLPIRLLFKIKMIYTEIFVWIIAIGINIISTLLYPDFYQITPLTKAFYEILIHPYPYWGIIILCGIGTMLSVHFGDEMLNVFLHKDRSMYHKHQFKYKILSIICILILILSLYEHLIIKVGIKL